MAAPTPSDPFPSERGSHLLSPADSTVVWASSGGFPATRPTWGLQAHLLWGGLTPCWVRGWGQTEVQAEAEGAGWDPTPLTAMQATTVQLHAPSPGLMRGLLRWLRQEAQARRGDGHQPDPSDQTPVSRTPDLSLDPTPAGPPRALPAIPERALGLSHPACGAGKQPARWVNALSSCRPGRRPPRPSCRGRSWSAAWTWRRPWAVWRRPSRGEAGRAWPAGLQGAAGRAGALGCWRLLLRDSESAPGGAGGAGRGPHPWASVCSLPCHPSNPQPPPQLGGLWPCYGQLT